MQLYRVFTDGSSSPVVKQTGNVRVTSVSVRLANVVVEKQQAIDMSVLAFLH
jgi:hypothetical protein